MTASQNAIKRVFDRVAADTKSAEPPFPETDLTQVAPITPASLEQSVAQLEQDIRDAAPEARLEVLRIKGRETFAPWLARGVSPREVDSEISLLVDKLSSCDADHFLEEALYEIADEITGRTPAPMQASSEVDFDRDGGTMGQDATPPLRDVGRTNERTARPSPLLKTVALKDWKDTMTPAKEWLVRNRIPADDLTVLQADGGSGKTETLVQLLIAVSHGLGDWLGAAVDKAGLCLFLSAEEDEGDIRGRVDRICKHRQIDAYANGNLHLCFPDLESALLVEPDRTGKLIKTGLFHSVVQWIETHRPVLVGIDANAAVFGGNAIDRGQVRSFIAMLRELGRGYGTTIVLLDHPSQRGKGDGSGTSGSVDWNNGPRARIYIKAVKGDHDARVLEVMKVNGGRAGETVNIRWNGLTFVTDKVGEAAPQRASAERKVDDLFLRLLAERNAQGRWVTPSKAVGYAPKELAAMPSAEGCTAAALANAMERLLAAKEIEVETYGYHSKPRQRFVITTSNRLPTGE